MTKEALRTPTAVFFDRVRQAVGLVPDGTPITLGENPLKVVDAVRVAWDKPPIHLTLADTELEAHPDFSLTGEELEGDREWIIHTGSGAFNDGVPIFIRVPPGQDVIIGRENKFQRTALGLSKKVAARHLRLTNRKGELVIQPLSPEHEVTVSILTTAISLWDMRRKNLDRLSKTLGHTIAPFDDENEALARMREVNAIVADEEWRERDDQGRPGGIIQFPDDKMVVLLGDTHARIENVLRVLTEGGMLKALEEDRLCFVFLGDLVHGQEEDELDDMTGTTFMLDLFAMLKLRFPRNVYYVRGNHESFSPDVGKGGVPQGLLLKKHLKKTRGSAYVTEIQKLFDNLAFIVQGKSFAACHAAPVRSTVTRETLVNIRRFPGIQYEIVWNRMRQSSRPAGYGKGSVKRFRETLGLPKHAPLIVAHTPMSLKHTAWMDVGGIRGHHIVYSAHLMRAAAMVIHDGRATALEFVPEPSLAYLAAQREATEA